ncbi:MAG: POTRA domain-containing protein, partial [Pseudomonadales bacterium]
MIYRLLALCILLAPVCSVFAQETIPEDAGKPVFLQVGAFAEEKNARDIEDRLKEAGLDHVWVLGAEVDRGFIYRVRIGPVGGSLNQQAAVIDQVRALGISDPILVRSPLPAEEYFSSEVAAAEGTVDRFVAQTAGSTPEQVQLVTSEPYRLPPLDVAPSAGTRQLSQMPKLFVQRIDVRGVTAFDDAEIESITRPYVNREVSNAELQDLRVALSRNYVEHQFANSGVVLPDQRVDDGVVLYEAIEGTLTRIEIEGDHHLSQRYVE